MNYLKKCWVGVCDQTCSVFFLVQSSCVVVVVTVSFLRLFQRFSRSLLPFVANVVARSQVWHSSPQPQCWLLNLSNAPDEYNSTSNYHHTSCKERHLSPLASDKWLFLPSAWKTKYSPPSWDFFLPIFNQPWPQLPPYCLFSNFLENYKKLWIFSPVVLVMFYFVIIYIIIIRSDIYKFWPPRSTKP